MEKQPVRRSDRILLELDIEITGCDVSGKEFLERTTTLVLSRHGAKILSQYMLVPQQEVVIKCLKTDKEAVASVVGTIGKVPEGYYYGIAFMDPEFDMWDIEFPALPENEAEGSKTVLQCLSCQKLEIANLGAFELEVLIASQRLLRFCERCGDYSVWRQITEAEARQLAPPPPPPPAQTRRVQNDRKHPRMALKVDACIRVPAGKEELVVTENVSLGGFRFLSKIPFQVGTAVEVAVPYAQGGLNIFVPARIAYLEKTNTEGVSGFGVCYITVKDASTLSGEQQKASS